MKYSVLDLAWAKGTSEPVRAALLEMHRKLNEQDVLLRQALEALKPAAGCISDDGCDYCPGCLADAAIAALKERLT